MCKIFQVLIDTLIRISIFHLFLSFPSVLVMTKSYYKTKCLYKGYIMVFYLKRTLSDSTIGKPIVLQIGLVLSLEQHIVLSQSPPSQLSPAQDCQVWNLNILESQVHPSITWFPEQPEREAPPPPKPSWK